MPRYWQIHPGQDKEKSMIVPTAHITDFVCILIIFSLLRGVSHQGKQAIAGYLLAFFKIYFVLLISDLRGTI